jgi:4-hydroxy-tetrahydrodipicolinate reductase
MLRIAVLGATGRMGQTLTRLIAENDALELVGAATEPGHASIGEDAGLVAGVSSLAVAVTDDIKKAVAGSQVAIDFTLPEAATENLAACVDRKVAMVMGTTGLSAAQQQALADAARHIGMVYGRNMSVGVNVLTALVGLAAKALGADYDVEISEAHHRHKVDAPSGTALQLGDAVARERGTTLDTVAIYERHGAQIPREPGSIGFTSVRAGGIVGEHTVLFATDEEIIELKHRAGDRALFARGALRAAQWVVGQPAGLYGMSDVLGLNGR